MQTKFSVLADTWIVTFVILGISVIIRAWPVFIGTALSASLMTIVWMIIKVNEPKEKMNTMLSLPAPKDENESLKISEELEFHELQRRISSEVQSIYPDGLWGWDSPNPRKAVKMTNPVKIRLGRAGGFSNAWIYLKHGRFYRLTHVSPEMSAGLNDSGAAWIWSLDNLMTIKKLIVKARRDGKEKFTFKPEVLPSPEYWDEICTELNFYGINSVWSDEGIEVFVDDQFSQTGGI